jgi:hypothetical protein
MGYSKDSEGVIVKNESGVIDSINPLDVNINNELLNQYSTLIDEASSTVTYIGIALPGTLTSSASWQIKKISANGTVTSILYADSNKNFDNVWDNRSSLVYG